VTVSIERLEVRAAPPPAPAFREARPARRVGLDEYATRRDRVGTR
jgi:hypothetical protein